MKKNIFGLLIFFIIILNYNSCWATDEVDVSNEFMKYNAVVRNNANNEEMAVRGFEVLLNIIKKNPESAEAFYGVTALKEFNNNEIVLAKLNYNVSELSTEKDTAEIIVYSKFIIDANIEEEKIKEIKESLKSKLLLLSQVENKNSYSELASYILIFYEENAKKYYELFKQYYPESNAMPLVELIFLNSEFYRSKKFTEDLKELNMLAEKYSQLKTPYGWSTSILFYVDMIDCYIALKDWTNAHEYYKKIKNLAPDYPFIDKLWTQIIMHEKGTIKTVDEVLEELNTIHEMKKAQKNK